jgi:hypothetical protein
MNTLAKWCNDNGVDINEHEKHGTYIIPNDGANLKGLHKLNDYVVTSNIMGVIWLSKIN